MIPALVCWAAAIQAPALSSRVFLKKPWWVEAGGREMVCVVVPIAARVFSGNQIPESASGEIRPPRSASLAIARTNPVWWAEVEAQLHPGSSVIARILLGSQEEALPGSAFMGKV